ncbi:amidase signature enzyme [Serendipita vermifera]|nr:amidase signature enzyme [Serendipita vermifera]
MTSTTDHDIPDLYDAEIFQLKNGLRAGRFTSAQLVKAYIARISEVNEKGPCLRAVLEINAAAVQEAEQLDEQRRHAQTKGEELPLLHGIPILVKDNIASKNPTGFDEKLNTTAGSVALLGCFPPEDATVIKKLREAGAIILGKLNMSEWAHWRGKIPSGWSSRGRQCTNPYFPGADPSGSSSGSGVAAAIGLAAGTLGSETDGSICHPSSIGNIVGLKPTVGLTSRSGVIPISKTQDSVGPMCRTVSDTAILLQAISGKDDTDEYTLQQPPVPDYISALRSDFLKGVRIGVLRGYYAERTAWKEEDPEEAITARLEAFDKAVEYMKELGAELVDSVEIETVDELVKNEDKELTIFYTEFKIGLNQYLSKLPEYPTRVRTLANVIEFNRTHPEAHYRGDERQHYMTKSEASEENEEYKETVAWYKSKSRDEGIDACLKKHSLDLLVTPWSTRTSYVPAVAGYPLLTLPLGFLPDSIEPVRRVPDEPYVSAPGLPFGIAFMGGAWSERTLIGCAYSLEQKLRTRWQRKAYHAAIPRSQINATVEVGNH